MIVNNHIHYWHRRASAKVQYSLYLGMIKSDGKTVEMVIAITYIPTVMPGSGITSVVILQDDGTLL